MMGDNMSHYIVDDTAAVAFFRSFQAMGALDYHTRSTTEIRSVTSVRSITLPEVVRSTSIASVQIMEVIEVPPGGSAI